MEKIIGIQKHAGKVRKNTSFIRVRVTPLEQLRLAEFSGELARPKGYENGNKNIQFGIAQY